MYQLVLDVGIVDYAVRAAIEKLSRQQHIITAAEIAAHIGCSDTTVRRTLPRLIEAGHIKRFGSKRNGYWYQIMEDQNAATR